jgi:hypothetical protein
MMNMERLSLKHIKIDCARAEEILSDDKQLVRSKATVTIANQQSL